MSAGAEATGPAGTRAVGRAGTVGASTAPARRVSPKSLALGAAVLLLLLAMVLDTHVVRIGSEADVRADVFSPEAYGAEQFPRIREQVAERAVDAPTLYEAAVADKAAAAAQYGTEGGIAPVFPVRFSGTVGEGRTGIFDVDVDGLPDDVRVRVQTGPAVNGTELRDLPGDILFGDFKNQIEYQDAGAAINDAMKGDVLADLDRDALTGREVNVVGVFRMINPKMWLVTPTEFEVL